MKANDKDVPEDEMLLAEALAAAKARGMKWTSAVPFRDSEGRQFYVDELQSAFASATQCCALGALALAGRITPRQAFFQNGGDSPPRELMEVYRGNDRPPTWEWDHDDDNGESLGWAFRCFMTQDDES